MLQKLEAWFEGLPPRLTAALFLIPFLYCLLHQLLWPKPWFTDFNAAACAGDALLHNMPIYPPKPACPVWGMAFVYTPGCARICALLQSQLGLRGETALYAVVYTLGLTGVLALLLRKPGLKARAPFLAGLSASGLRFGNLSVLLHAGILFTAWRFAARPVLLIAPIALACIIKPTFAVYAALFLFTVGPWWRRVVCGAVTLLPAFGYFIYFNLSDPNLFNAFLAVSRLWGMQLDHGHGFLSLISLAGITNFAAIYLLYAAYAVLLLLCGLVLAQSSSPAQRLMLGIAVCILLYPRLMPYDQFTLPIGMGLLAQQGGKTTQRLCLGIGLACLVTGGNMGGQVLYIGSCVLLIGRAAVDWRGTIAGQAAREFFLRLQPAGR
jgi:hypothetical protein